MMCVSVSEHTRTQKNQNQNAIIAIAHSTKQVNQRH